MNRFVPTMSFADYLADPAWGSHSLKAMRQGPPARVVYERTHPKPQTDAMRLGTAAHLAATNFDAFRAVYVCKPDGMSFATKEGKAWREAAGNSIILTYYEYRTCEALPTALMSKPIVAEVLATMSCSECSMFWDEPISGEACKGRPDWIAGQHIYDLKVSRDAASPWLAHRAFASGYFHQIAHYRDGAQLNGFPVTGGRLIYVDPQPPHFVYCIEVKPDSLDLLQLENIATLERMRDCRLKNDWPGTPDEWTLVEPPPSALNNIILDMETIDE